MKTTRESFLILVLLLIVVGCAKTIPDVPTLIKVDAKSESDGLRNHMILYAVKGKFDASDFSVLCTSLKSNPISSGINYIVVFDDAANAGFPKSPFSSLYGLEEDRIKHILAVYEYNAVNGFSESRVYEPNMWSGTPSVTTP